MKTRIIVLAGLAATGAGAAVAGGIDRSGQPISPLFEKGNYAEVSLGYVSPSVSGKAVATYGGFSSGDMAGSYLVPGFAFKSDITPKFAAALIYDQPIGANVTYPSNTFYYAQSAVAKLSTNSLTALAKYRFDNNISVYGGPRWQTIREHINHYPLGTHSYSAQGEGKGSFGYVLGIAYEKPEIGLRLALTYNSEIDYNVPTKEQVDGVLVSQSTTPILSPRSLNFDFQTGINPTTLVFGSVRWANWNKFKIAPVYFSQATYAATGKALPLIVLHHNTVTYSLGVGHKFTENWSGAVTVGYEPKVDGFASDLSPVNGSASIGVGATYTQGKMKITGGISYIWIGDAQTSIDKVTPAANFTSNHAVAAGLKVGWNF